jgi:hypothetical protein
MKISFPRLGTSLILVTFLGACSLQQANPKTDADIVATKVAATLAALTQSAQQTLPYSSSSPTAIQSTFTQPATLVPSPTPGLPITPTDTLIPSATAGPTMTPTPLPGTIAGSVIGYPYGSVPALAIVAFGQDPPKNYSFAITGAGQTFFSMTTKYLLPGHYQVVAYDSSGHSGGCPGTVLVISEQIVNCDVSIWGGGYPAKPSGVPNP